MNTAATQGQSSQDPGPPVQAPHPQQPTMSSENFREVCMSLDQRLYTELSNRFESALAALREGVGVITERQRHAEGRIEALVAIVNNIQAPYDDERVLREWLVLRTDVNHLMEARNADKRTEAEDHPQVLDETSLPEDLFHT